MLLTASLNSGSNGNCYYVGTPNEAVLIDAGISCRETEKRLKRLNLSMDFVKAIFITHEHNDHIIGVTKLSKKYNLPVYITPQTLHKSPVRIASDLVRNFIAYEPVAIGALHITGFPKYHDAADPHSFVVSHDAVHVGVFTDIGFACQLVIHHFKKCHAVYLESNYDADMLRTGPYPLALQNRIRGGYGHLSNYEARNLVAQHKPTFLSHLILSHLSRTNNKPELVESLFNDVAPSTRVIIASRHRETELFKIEANPNHLPSTQPILYVKQLELF
jgi:phosphoribosyl 1,2-cyclic phosphodiesterase